MPHRLPILLILLLTSQLHASDWPQFRGPNRDNNWPEKNILRTFPKTGPKILWRAKIGPGYSSPVIAAGRVYVTDSLLTNPTTRERLHCFDENTGQPLWTHSYDPGYPNWVFQDKTGMGPTSTPIVHGGKIYTFGAMGHLHCLDAQTGQPIWQKDLIKEYQVLEFSPRTSPLVEENLVILNIGGKPNAALVAFDRNSGAEIWKCLDEALTNSSPITITAGGRRQLILWTQSSITSLNPTTGKTWWREHLITDNNSAAAAPVFNKDSNLLLAGGIMLKLDQGKPAAALLWPQGKPRAQRLLSNTSTPLFLGQHIFWAKSSEHLICTDAATGKELWKTDQVTPIRTGNAINMTQSGDVVFIYTDEGNLIIAQLTAAGYNELDRTHLIDPTFIYGDRKVAWAAPAYANQKIFVRTDKEILCASLAAPP